MNRSVTLLLTILLMTGMWVAPVAAQSDGPTPPATVHVVQRGETLFAIAQQYGTTVDAITHANGISDPRRVYVGQRLVIPGGEANLQETEPYLVLAGDTLASVARRYQTTWQALVHINGLLSPNTIYVGQVIQVPRIGGLAGVEETANTLVGGSLVHVVRADDTLLRVALRYDISLWALAAFNHVANPVLIYPGQELVVPGEGPGLLPAPFASVKVQPLPVSQGMTIVVTVRTTEPVTLEGRLFGRTVSLAKEGDAYYGLAGMHVFTEPGLYELELTAVDGEGQSTAITTAIVVGAGRFGYERIDLPESRTSLLDPSINATELEYLIEHQVYSPERRWTVPFQRPCVGTISAYFGTHRAYNDGPYTSYHTGVDFRAPAGTPVHAAGAGVVVLAEPLTVRGNTVVIDHGWGLLTGYWHLSSIEVQVGQEVSPGDIIGRVGNTGLSTGAHLHWETWVGGISVDGLQWMEGSYPWLEPEWLAVGG